MWASLKAAHAASTAFTSTLRSTVKKKPNEQDSRESRNPHGAGRERGAEEEEEEEAVHPGSFERTAPEDGLQLRADCRSTDARLELLKKLLKKEKKEKKKKRQKKLDKDKKASKFDEAQRGRSPARRCGSCALPPPCFSKFRGATAPSVSRHRRAE